MSDQVLKCMDIVSGQSCNPIRSTANVYLATNHMYYWCVCVCVCVCASSAVERVLFMRLLLKIHCVNINVGVIVESGCGYKNYCECVLL